MTREKEVDEEKLKELWSDSSLTIKQVANMLGISCATLYKNAARACLPKRTSPRYNRPIDAAKLSRLWNDQTITVKAVARQLGVSYQRMNVLRIKLGLPSRERKGENNKGVDPTPEEIVNRAAAVKANRLAELRESEHEIRDRPANIRNFTHCNDCYQAAPLLS